MDTAMIRARYICVGLFCIVNVVACRAMAGLTLADKGKSNYSIVVSAQAPSSVNEAARELQRDIHAASDVELPIVKDDASITGPIISLGMTRQAGKAGLTTSDLQVEGYRILTRENDLYILGVDTPDGGKTARGGVSDGTARGVYTFLEQYLGVRWLLPGDLGRDVPVHTTLELPDIDQSYAPTFTWRKVDQVRYYANRSQIGAVRQWCARQGVDVQFGRFSTHFNANHNWGRTVPRELFKTHPDWFAMGADGKRHPSNKLETTNPELVKFFAQKAIEALQDPDRPWPGTFSLSPSDGRGWSQSPQSKALYDPPPPGRLHPSVTPLILKWYHDVATIVAKKYPQGHLYGYLYQDFFYPPQQGSMTLPTNFTPVMAFSPSYGYGLYRKQTQELFKYVMDAWAKVIPGDWYYYDLPGQLDGQDHVELGSWSEGNFPGSTGIVTPAAPDILNTIFSTLMRDHIKGAYLYCVPSWSNAAMSNYIIAKMMWNPRLDAYAVQKDWLHRAYGPKAGAVMGQFYEALNGWFRDYYQKNETVQHSLTTGMLKDLYAAHYGEMERLYLKALNQPMEAKQKQRLQLIGDNLIVLQWRLRNAGYWPKNLESALQRSGREVIDIITRPSPDFQSFPGITTSDKVLYTRPKPFPWKVQWSDKTPTAPGKMPPGLNDNTFVIYAAQDGEVRIQPQRVVQGPYFASYEVKDGAGKVIQSGIFNEGSPVHFSVKAKQAYYLYIPPRKPVQYKLLVKDAVVAAGNYQDKVLTLTGESAPIAVFCPAVESPIGGAYEKGSAVILQKPYTGAAAKTRFQQRRPEYRHVTVLQNLDIGWRFSPDPADTGLKRGVTGPDFDDSQWATLSALDWWQRQGFADYHGPAWYRTTFNADKLPADQVAMLYFGAVDGNAVVYLNGQKIGTHTLGENYKGWNWFFFIDATKTFRSGQNTLVVKVTSKNNTSGSGIFRGVSLLTATDKP